MQTICFARKEAMNQRDITKIKQIKNTNAKTTKQIINQ